MELKRPSLNSLVDFTTSVTSGTYTITFGTSHPAGANYVIQLSGQNVVATVSSSNVPTAAAVRVVLYSLSASWATPTVQPLFLCVLH